MKRTWTIIGVRDVSASLKWYQAIFGQPETPPAHNDFDQILDADGTVLLCLHQWGAHGHPSLLSPDEATPGNGLLLFFRVDHFDIALKRARALVARFDEEPHLNPSTRTNEFSLRDPDGYCVTISALEPTMTAKDFRRIALAMEDAVEGAHMGHPDFRVGGRIFATLHQDLQNGMVKLTPEQQQRFANDHADGFTPENGAWGLQGSTRVHLGAVDENALGEAMTLAWQNTINKSPARKAPGPKRALVRKKTRGK